MLPTILLAAAAASSIFPAPGTYRYTAALGAQRIGEWSVSVKGGESGTEIDENSSASFAGMQIGATASLVLGPDLAPTRYAGSYRTAGQNPTVNVALTPASATIVGGMAGRHEPSPRAEYATFRRDRTGLARRAFRPAGTAAAWGKSPVTWIAPITGQEQTIVKDSANPTPRPSSVPAQDVALSVRANPGDDLVRSGDARARRSHRSVAERRAYARTTLNSAGSNGGSEESRAVDRAASPKHGWTTSSRRRSYRE